MSDINYDVWGTPETWGVWSDSPTSNAIWGNIRVGASNYTNADFTDYPPFKLGGTNQTLRAKCNAGEISVNTPLDNTIAYTAIANPELPQCNVGLFGKGHTTKNNPLAFRDAENPLPFALAYFNDLNDTYFNMSSYQQIYGFDGFPDNATVIGQQSLQRWSPYATMNVASTTTAFEYNQQGQIMPVLSFGIKSVIFEIVIRYVDNNDETLKTNLNQNDTWLQSHKCVGAYLRPYYRVNTDGTYSYTIPTGVTTKDRANGIQPIFFTSYKMQGIDIYNYSSQWARAAGCLPIYGNCIVDSSYIYRGINSYLYDNPDNDTCSYWALMYGYNKGNLHVDESGNGANTYITLDLSVAENVEYIMRGAAAYGLFFCKAIGTLGSSGRDSGATERWLDDEMYCGVIAADGCTYGDYTQGEGNKDNQVYGWTNSTQTPYVPGSGTDPNAYSNKTKFNVMSNTCSMARHYVLNGANVLKLAGDLWSITAMLSDNQTDFDHFDGKLKDEFLTNDPIDCIISLRRFPFDIPYDSGDGEYIKLGKTSGSAYGYTVANHPLYFNFRSVKIYPRFGDSFLDYSPYTEYELYVPFCGTTKLDAGDILGHTLNVRLVVDITTGSCTGYIMADELVIQSVTGSIAIEIPITGTDAATINSQIMNGVISQYHAEKQERLTFASQFTPAGLFKNLMSLGVSAQAQLDAAAAQTDKANYDLTHIQAPIHKIGTATAGEKWAIDLQCRLLIYYPEGSAVTSSIPPSLNSSVIEKYGAVQGFATVELGNVEDYSGLLSGISPRLENIYTANGEPASSEELQLIEQAIQQGIII